MTRTLIALLLIVLFCVLLGLEGLSHRRVILFGRVSENRQPETRRKGFVLKSQRQWIRAVFLWSRSFQGLRAGLGRVGWASGAGFSSGSGLSVSDRRVGTELGAGFVWLDLMVSEELGLEGLRSGR